MAGLLAWAADVVGGGGVDSDGGDALNRIPLLFSPEQQKYVRELDQKAASLTRLIQDLRQRLPPPDISQSLPHLHAHTLASNAALARQLNAHSTTREQAQLREATLQAENADFERAISNCENKMQEKVQEADLLRRKLEEMNETEKKLKAELDNLKRQNSVDTDQSVRSHGWKEESNIKPEAGTDADASDSVMLNKLEEKNKELSSMEEIVRKLEEKWTEMQENALEHPSPAQREKALDKQLHSLIEQLAAKQAQAEGLLSEIHLKEMELERLNGQWRRMESNITEANTARNRFGRSSSDKGYALLDYDGDGHHKLPYYSDGRNESQQRIMLLRSAFVLYILALHVIVFIKISF
ncbi:trichoplein keratin filament-binding protein [Neltuma alba]|uniref:trichoplein keratin filament-binding protein n=1 Tax=Neltuma alba TaxID=207710 RepID=UPI0010A5165D|nr:trichoplein keratin filament-binding protein-like [Prosopis alba]